MFSSLNFLRQPDMLGMIVRVLLALICGDEVLAPLVAQTHQLHPQLEQVHNVQLAAPHLLELFRQLPGVLLVQLLNGFYKFFLH